MVQMAVIWIISVVAFFVLWALLASIVRKVSEKKVESDEMKPENTEVKVENEQNNQQNIQQ